MENLYQPIRFKRWKLSKWERGFFRISSEGETFLEEDRETVVNQVYRYKIDWNIKF